MRTLKLMILAVFIIGSLDEKADCQVLFGIKGGANLTKGVFDEVNSKTDFAVKYHVGLQAQIPLTESLYIKPELLYSVKGWGIGNNQTVSLSYLNLPILAGYNIKRNFSIYAGPEFGYKLNEKIGNSNPGFEFYKKFDFGLAIGTSYMINSRFGIDLRYVHGFKDLINGKITYVDEFGNMTYGKKRDGSNRVIMFGVFFYFNSPK